jgi:hypothetical protein
LRIINKLRILFPCEARNEHKKETRIKHQTIFTAVTKSNYIYNMYNFYNIKQHQTTVTTSNNNHNTKQHKTTSNNIYNNYNFYNLITSKMNRTVVRNGLSLNNETKT